ncbi:lysosomal acid phosphatase-like [Macrosteles quadrilineatus]|uniref:lysosomal acid phosphatase-like n=1 Tax=Macrosteles quadrilineatus TaxID=74068 RepID=UPI0023E2298C|nr:lysosomal acid phosphatase-like [Macrosteles quadrilineatus]
MIVACCVCVVFFHVAEMAITTNGTRAAPSLEFLIVISKHGARTPTHTYPTDPYRNISMWPDGKGQITRVGKQQMYRVGRKLRHLYNGYLSHMYHGSQLMAQATLVDRAMVSAATLLAGLYPPQGFQRWHPNITWLPVPVYPNLLDKTLISLDARQCPRYWVEQNRSLADLAQNYSHYIPLYHIASEGSGTNISTCSALYLLSQNLACMVDNGLSLPSWAEEVFQSRVLPAVSGMVRDTTFRNTKMLRILSGMLLDKIADLLKRKSRSDKEDSLRATLHVGNDLTLMCVLAALGLGDQLMPWSATSLLVELHSNPQLPSGYQVEVLKIDGRVHSYSPPEVIELPACASPCDRDVFLSHLSKYTVAMTDWRNECMDLSSPSD